MWCAVCVVYLSMWFMEVMSLVLGRSSLLVLSFVFFFAVMLGPSLFGWCCLPLPPSGGAAFSSSLWMVLLSPAVVRCCLLRLLAEVLPFPLCLTLKKSLI